MNRIDRKKKGKTLNIDSDDGGADPRGTNVVDLMAALKKSVGSGTAKKSPAPEAAAKPAAKKKAPAKKRA